MDDLSQRSLGQLLQAANSAAADQLPSAIQEGLAGAGVRNVVLYLSDYDRTILRPFPVSASAQKESPPQDVQSNSATRSWQEQRLVEGGPGGRCLWVPVSERADQIGVLELEFEHLDDESRRLAVDAGVLVGYLLVTARRYTDEYELMRRRRSMNLAAEMHWDILPATSYIGPGLEIGGALEPAYEIGGDAFDYSVNGRMLDFTILDAMGHGLEAALLSAQAVSAYRYARRRREPLADTVLTLESVLLRQFGGNKFVTGLLGRLDLVTGLLSWIAAGHVAPLLLRNGRVRELSEAPLACPMGIEVIEDVREASVQLEKGDRVLLYSDGVIEARAPNGEYLQLDTLKDLIEGWDHSTGISELVQGLIQEVVEHSAGPLRDDATIFGLDYSGLEPSWEADQTLSSR
jgi:serine phosphatase RsbU (regulator of sigma subunit)